MSWVERFYLQDLIEVQGESVTETKKRVKVKLEKSGLFNYNTARNVCFKSPGGELSYNQALQSASSLKFELARNSNSSAIKLLHPYFSTKNGRFYPTEKEYYRYSADYACQVKMLGLLHNGSTGCLYWPNFRKTAPVSNFASEIIFSVASMLYLRDPDYKEFDLRIIDLSAGEDGERQLREFCIEDARIWSDDELSEFFNPIYLAISELQKENYKPKEKPKPRHQIINEPDLFV